MVSAFVSNNTITSSELAGLITTVAGPPSKFGAEQSAGETLIGAVARLQL
jgi:predicted transcriptional regulator